jgi:hypothetical protein
MDDGKYDDLIGHRVKVDRIRKPPEECTACFAVDAGKRERSLDDTRKRLIDLRRKGLAKPGPLGLVSVTGIEQLRLRLTDGEQDVVSRSSEELPTHLVPGDGRLGVRDVFCKAAVEFSALLGREIELGFLLGWLKAAPQGHGEFDPFGGGEVQELRQGVSQHDPILPCPVGAHNQPSPLRRTLAVSRRALHDTRRPQSCLVA